MKRTMAVMLFCLLSGSLCGVHAHTLKLDGTIRDFVQSHPDFERAICGQVNDLVESDLGPDKNPMYGLNGESCIQSTSSLSEWYDQSENTQETDYTMVLNNGQPGHGGTYTFWASHNFFPIDNQLFGNEGWPHNYHFTLEVHSSFVYRGGETFHYESDDDLWVFIDDQLVVDAGGIHYGVSGILSVDALGLVVGQRYDFDLFFAERHTDFSTLTIQTSIIFGLFSDGFESGDLDEWSEVLQ